MERLLALMIVFALTAAGPTGTHAAPAGGANFADPADLPSNPGLPDPFTFMDGTKVETPADWTGRRRPELIALFQHYM